MCLRSAEEAGEARRKEGGTGAQHRVGTDLSPVSSCDASQGKLWLVREVPTAASPSPDIRSHSKFMAELGLEPSPFQALGLCFYHTLPIQAAYPRPYPRQGCG